MRDTQLFLVMDHKELPEHIIQTFKLAPANRGWQSGLLGIGVAVEGDEIDLTAGGYILVFAYNDWHNDQAGRLYDQIKALRKDAQVLVVPVEVETKREEPHLFQIGLDGGTIPITIKP